MTILADTALDQEKFWQFCLTCWQEEALKKACLKAQDQWMADVTLLLFFHYLSKEGLCLAGAESLYTLSSDWQRAVMRPLRTARTGLKGTDHYSRIQALELDLEKDFLASLIAEVKEKELATPGAATDQCDICAALLADYFAYLSLLAPQEEALKMARLFKQFI